MFQFALNPFFWAVISLFGLLGASTSVNTKYGRQFRWSGLLFSSLFSFGRWVMVLPFVNQSRFTVTPIILISGIIFGLFALVFFIPVLKTQPLSKPFVKTKLSTSGVYKIVRHPFYSGEILISLSLSLIFGSYVGLAFIPIWWSGLTLHAINEEEFLENEFGPLYLEYKSRVKGRIIPLPPFGKSKSIPKFPFKNLVFKGGGMKGAAYSGALQALEKEGILDQIERVAGSSAGAITATLLSFNLDLKTTLDLMDTLDFSLVPQLNPKFEIKEPEWLPKFIGKEVNKLSSDMGAIQRLVSKYGWFSSEYFHTWLKNIIADNCDGNASATFKDFREHGFKDLYIVTTNVSSLEIVVFSFDTTPDICVADAVRMSMSIPLYFESLQFNGNKLGDGDLFVDGGVLKNYPIHVFDHPKYADGNLWFQNDINWETLGFYLYSYPGKIAKDKDIHNFKDFISHLYECYNISLQISEIDHNKIDQRRTVKIDTLDIQATDFLLKSNKTKYQELINQGYNATETFLNEYWHPSKTVKL